MTKCLTKERFGCLLHRVFEHFLRVLEELSVVTDMASS